MKKSRLLIAVLAATMFVLAAFGFVACDKDAGDLLQQAATDAKVYTITLDYGAGSGTPATTATVNGKIVSLPTPTPPANHTNKGWYTAATGGTQVTTATTFDKNTTIYAQYTENSTPDPNPNPNPNPNPDPNPNPNPNPNPDPNPNPNPNPDPTPDYSTNGVYIGSQCYALTLNGESSRTEYWFGGSKYTFTEGNTMSIYMNGEKISAYLESSSEGVDKTVTDEEISEFTVTLTGEFAVYLHQNDNDWSVEFAGPTNFGGENQLPGGTPFTLTGSDGNSVTIYIRDENGNDVTNLGNYKLWAWNDNGNFFSNWDARPTINATMTTTAQLGSKCNVIITWGSSQTGNFNGLEAGKTYVITIAAGSGTIAVINV